MNIAIILAGGIGTRLGSDIPKQYIEVKGKPIISYCLDIFFSHSMIHAIQIVADESWHKYIMESISDNQYVEKWKGFSEPGQNRQLSIFHALEDVFQYASSDDCVMIHDAVRPLVSSNLIAASFEHIKGHDGVLPVLSMSDTIYYSEDGNCISSLLKRENIYAGQAPEVFQLGTYYEANKLLLPDEILKINGATEPAILAGMDIVMIDGDENNFKITTKGDLERFRQKIGI